MKIILSYRRDIWRDRVVECYPTCYAKRLLEKGHDIVEIGEGHSIVKIEDVDVSKWDLLLEIENGRGEDGKLRFQLQNSTPLVTSAVVLIDSHGHPDLHKSIAGLYSHVFFAVHAQRDLFVSHPSAHWLPCTSDPEFFCPHVPVGKKPGSRRPVFKQHFPKFQFGFFGSKTGLYRGDILKEACQELGYSHDIRQVGKAHRHRWPETCEAMHECRYLFNKGQKHDGPNQRVIESMAVKKLLFNDIDEREGMSLLFEEGKHFLGYKDKNELKEKMLWAVNNPVLADTIAKAGWGEVRSKHFVTHRLDRILEVVG